MKDCLEVSVAGQGEVSQDSSSPLTAAILSSVSKEVRFEEHFATPLPSPCRYRKIPPAESIAICFSVVVDFYASPKLWPVDLPVLSWRWTSQGVNPEPAARLRIVRNYHLAGRYMVNQLLTGTDNYMTSLSQERCARNPIDCEKWDFQSRKWINLKGILLLFKQSQPKKHTDLKYKLFMTNIWKMNNNTSLFEWLHCIEGGRWRQSLTVVVVWQLCVPLNISNTLASSSPFRSHWLMFRLVNSMSIVATPLPGKQNGRFHSCVYMLTFQMRIRRFQVASSN